MSPAIWGSLTALCWGVGDVMGRFVGQRLGLVIALFGMMLTSGLGLGLYAWLVGATLVWAPEALWTLLLSGVGIAGGTLFLFWSLIRGPLSVASPICASYPVVNLAIAVASGRTPGLVEWLAIAAVLAGVALTARSGDAQAGTTAPGGRRVTAIIALASSLCFAFGIWGMQLAQPVYGEIQTLLAVRLCGTLGTAVTLLLVPSHRGRVGPLQWPLLLVMGSLDLAAYFALMAGTAGARPEIAVVVASAYCIFPVLFGRLVLKETVTASQGVGIAMIVGGVGYLASLH